MKPIITITGASGFLGKYLTHRLGQDCFLRAISTHPVSHVHETRVGNLEDDSFLRKAVIGSHAIVHAAAITHPLDPDLERINIKYTQKLVQAAKKMGVKQFIYISTENVTQHCVDPYTLSKVKAEEIISALYPDALILRPSIIFGKGDTRYLSTFAKIITFFPCIPVPSHYTIQPIHADDVAAFVSQGLRLRRHGIYTLVGSPPISFAELGKMIARCLGKKRFFIPIPSFFFRFAIFILRHGTRQMRRFAYMLSNACIQRNVDRNESEIAFHYSPLPFFIRLNNSINL